MDPSTGTIFKARFANCKFVEDKFPTPPSDRLNKQVLLTFQAPETLTMNLDPRTALAEIEVTKLSNLQDLAEQIPDGFYSEPPYYVTAYLGHTTFCLLRDMLHQCPNDNE